MSLTTTSMTGWVIQGFGPEAVFIEHYSYKVVYFFEMMLEEGDKNGEGLKIV